jgi:hypothetical protein
MVQILLALTLIAGEDQEFLNGIVGVVNADVITSRDVKIYSGLKELEGSKLEFEEALNQLIEESIVFQSAEEQGMEPEGLLINRCAEKINRLVREKKNRLLEESGYTEKDGEKRCLRTETMKLFIENKFLKPAIVNTGKFTGVALEEYQKIAIGDYKIWLDDVIKKFKIEKFEEYLAAQGKR